MKAISRILKPLEKKHVLPLQTIAEEGTDRVNALTDSEIKQRMKRIDEDFRHAFRLLKKHPNTVTFFGSASLPPESKYCKQARALAYKIVQELGLTIVSGGGPGIMEASNRGALEARGESVGLAIELPQEQVKNGYTTHSADFYYFFSRKVALTFTARAYVYFPGGYGTLDELFEILTLKETGKIPALPVILVGSDYWRPLVRFLEQVVYEKTSAISKADLGLFVVEDDPDEIVRLIASGK